MHEPRRRFALFGQHFSAPAERGTRTAQACSSLTDGEFFAEIRRGVALCGAREIAASAAGTAPYPRRWAKRKGHLRFPFLFELLPFPCLLVWRRLPTCDRFEKEYGRGFLLPCFSQSVRRVRYITATQAVKFPQAQHDRVAQLFNTLYRTAPTRINYTRHLNSQMPCVTTCQGFARHGYVAPAQSKPPV